MARSSGSIGADYVRGLPALDAPVTRGKLVPTEDGGLLFVARGAEVFRLACAELVAASVDWRPPKGVGIGRRLARGLLKNESDSIGTLAIQIERDGARHVLELFVLCDDGHDVLRRRAELAALAGHASHLPVIPQDELPRLARG